MQNFVQKKTGKIFLILALAIAVTFTLIGYVSAEEVDLSGETITIIVPFGVGGGTDVTSRIYQPFFEKYLPGNPRVKVENVSGGGGIVGANHFETRAKPDGRTIFFSSGSVTLPMLFGEEAVRYSYADWEIIMAQPVGFTIYTRKDTGIKNYNDLKDYDKTLDWASSGPLSIDHAATMSLTILGLDIKSTHGYGGSGARRIANEQGEANIDYQTTAAYLENVVPLIEEGLFVPLYTFGKLNDEGEIVRAPEAPDLPTFKEIYKEFKGKDPDGQTDYEAWKALFLAGVALQKPVFLPEGTPEKYVEAYREAVANMRDDPEFQKAVKEKLHYPPLVGETAKTALFEAIDIDDDVKGYLEKWFKENNDADINVR